MDNGHLQRHREQHRGPQPAVGEQAVPCDAGLGPGVEAIEELRRHRHRDARCAGARQILVVFDQAPGQKQVDGQQGEQRHDEPHAGDADPYADIDRARRLAARRPGPGLLHPAQHGIGHHDDGDGDGVHWPAPPSLPRPSIHLAARATAAATSARGRSFRASSVDALATCAPSPAGQQAFKSGPVSIASDRFRPAGRSPGRRPPGPARSHGPDARPCASATRLRH